nr:condensation domain-containing protein [Micromonospora sp. DSM 115978]
MSNNFVVRSGMRFADAAVPDEWATEPLIPVEFRGGRTETAPLTWAQQVMWRAAVTGGSQHRFLNLRRTLPISTRVRADLASVGQALGALVGRHASLRTRVRPVEGEPRQETAAAGLLPVLVTESDGDGAEAARRLADRLGDVAFDHEREWPLRVALIVVDDRVRQIVIVFSHSTVDAYAAEVVLRELRVILLRGRLTVPAGPQSVDVARRQRTADRWRSDRAVDFWIRQFARLPQPPLASIGPGLRPRLCRGVLVSSAVRQCARQVATRHRVSTSAVLLAAATATAAGRDGRELCGLFNMAHNRFRAEYRNAVANLGQIGFCVVDISDRPSFAELLPRIWRESLVGYRHAYYDPAAMRRRFEEDGHDYGTAFLPYYYFNDVRLAGGDGRHRPAGDSAATAVDEPPATRSAFSWTDGLDRASWHLLTHVVDEPGAVGVTLSVDTRFLAPDSVEPFLRDVEKLLAEAATRDVPWPWSVCPGRP